VDGDLKLAADLLQAGKLPEAELALVRAEGRVAGGGPSDLRERVRQMRTSLTLVGRLDRIRLNRATVVDGKFDAVSAEVAYALLFQEQGLAVERDDPAAAAARLHDSPVRGQLLAALDDWAVCTAKPARRQWLLDVARRTDPAAWAARFRDPAIWGDRAALERLAREANVAELSPQVLVALGHALGRTGADPVPLWTAAQQHHPGDFWLNFQLGNRLTASRPDDALAYYRAALAVRPDTCAVYTNLGNVLEARGRVDEALEANRRAVALEPQEAKCHYNLGNALKRKGRLDEAVTQFRRAIALDPKHARAHNNLGNALSDLGRLDEAVQAYHHAIALDRNDAKAHYNLGFLLYGQGRVDDAVREYGLAVTLNPRYAMAHGALGQARLRQGRFAEARDASRRALELLPPNHALRKLVTHNLRQSERLLAMGEALPALLGGQAEPADPADRLVLARWCHELKDLPATAARLYAAAFADQPQWADDLREGHRYAAACAAARAGAGRGQDAGPLSEAERARLRGQALAWLRADLAAWGKAMGKPSPQTRTSVRQTLQAWRKEPKLAGLRDEAALTTLPASEQEAWRQLWADADALLQRSQATTPPPAAGASRPGPS
jgi:Flp pilus assembly protein TadD